MTSSTAAAEPRSLSGFVRHLDDGNFMLCCCDHCGSYSVPNAEQCETCGSLALQWRAATGGAKLVSSAYDNVSGASDSMLQPVVIAQFSEGPWWWGRLLLERAVTLQVDVELRVDVVSDPDGSSVRIFRLAT
jgi:uncharacterized OB-fold protein